MKYRIATMLILSTATLFISGSTVAQGRGRIAFISDRDGANQVYVMDADGGNVRRLTGVPGGWADGVHSGLTDAPSWSPDGSRVAFVAGFHVRIVDADGADMGRILDFRVVGRGSAWSPDGRWIAYAGSQIETKSIHVVRPDGGGLRAATRAGITWHLDPSWSPDGRRIAYWTFERAPLGKMPEVFVADLEGEAQIPLTDGAREDRYPVWSPDGRAIALTRHIGAAWEVVAFDLESGNVRNLTRHPAHDERPAWSPDGGHLAFHTNRDSNREIYTITVEGNDETNLTRHPSSDTGPSWVDSSLNASPSSLMLSVWSVLKRR